MSNCSLLPPGSDVDGLDWSSDGMDARGKESGMEAFVRGNVEFGGEVMADFAISSSMTGSDFGTLWGVSLLSLSTEG